MPHKVGPSWHFATGGGQKKCENEQFYWSVGGVDVIKYFPSAESLAGKGLADWA